MQKLGIILGLLLVGILLFGCITITDLSQNNTIQNQTTNHCPNSTGDTVTMKYDGTTFWIHSFNVKFSDGWITRAPGPNGDIASIPCHWGWTEGMENPNQLYCAAGLLSMSAYKDKIVSQNGTVTGTKEGIGIGFVLSTNESIDHNQFDTTTFHIVEMGCSDPIEIQ